MKRINRIGTIVAFIGFAGNWIIDDLNGMVFFGFMLVVLTIQFYSNH